MTDQPSLFTLTEAAERTGLTVDAMRKRIKRGTLEMVKGNDGLVRVRLTSADMDGLRPAGGGTEASRADESRTLRAMELELVAAREAVIRERERADLAAADREAARIAAAAAEGEVRGLREALAEARRPFWRRWLGA
jgi:hypothetical protein